MRDRRWFALGARSLSILAWLVIVVVMIRVLSGGGTLTGVGYVLSTESPIELAFMAGSFIVAAAAMVAIARDRPGAWSFAWMGAVFAMISSVVLLVSDHESAAIAIAAAGLALVVAVAMASPAGRTR